MNTPKPDDRSDNEAKIRRAMANTKKQIEAAEEMIAETSDPKTRAELRAKNERRTQAIQDMEREAQQEAEFNKNNK